MRIVAEALPRFDAATVVVAVACAAKVDEGQDMATLEHSPAWSALQGRLIDCASLLEPRGMSMVAYAAARLMWGDTRLLDGLADTGVRRAGDFGATDVAKSSWAFAKLRYVEEPAADSFWKALSREAERTVPGARFVDVSMMAWAFAITGRPAPGLFAAAAASVRAACAADPPLPPRSLAGIAWACAKARHRDPALYRMIADRSEAAASEFTAHDAAALCWALAAAPGAAPHAEARLYRAMGGHLVASSLVRRLSPPLAAELAWGFAAAAVPHGPLFRELASLCVSHITELETEDVVGFAWAFATAGWRDPEVFKAIATYLERFSGRLRASERKMLAWALEEHRATVDGGGGRDAPPRDDAADRY